MDLTSTTTAAASAAIEGTSVFQQHWLWALVLAFHFSFTFAFAMGANEVSNAFATSVSSGAITLRMAYFLATIVESAGGILLGYKVLETLRFKVIDLPLYDGTPHELLLGQVAILASAALWMLLANATRLPVSSTHSHIGSIIGFSLVMRGMTGLHWKKVIEINISWVVSPILSGLISASIYILLDIAVLRRKNPLKAAFRMMPIFYFLVLAFITFMVVFEGSKWIGFDKTPLWLAITVAVVVGLIAAIVFQVVIRPFLVKWIHRVDKNEEQNTALNAVSLEAANAGHSSIQNGVVHNKDEQHDEEHPQHHQQKAVLRRPPGCLGWLLPDRNRKDDPQTLRLFGAVQVFTGCFTGFSHGSKDIPNTIAPLATLVFVYNNLKVPPVQETPIWILCYGSLATCIGFWMLGHRVIKRVGTEFTEINPFAGFCIELGAALTVVVASKLGIPISMTLCIVGSIVAVGAVRGSVPVNWPLFRNVFLAWVVTFPFSGLIAAFVMFLLKSFFL